MTQAFNLSQLANYVNSSGQLDAGTGLTNLTAITFPSGTLMLFVQSAAPVGWTKSTTHNNKALRIVSGTASSGGSVDFTTAFSSGLSSGNTTLSTAQIPSHNHLGGSPRIWDAANGIYGNTGDQGLIDYPLARYANANPLYRLDYTSNSGGDGAHSHTLPSFAVQYVDAIIASKN
jgi:hypothetical protein